MRKTNYKIFYIYLLIIGMILFNIIFTRYTITSYNSIINPLLWFITGLLSYFLFKDYNPRKRYIKDKTEVVTIIMLFYFIIYFLLGLFFTFSRSIYSQTFFGIIKNIYMFLSVIILKEYTRSQLINNCGKSKFHIVLITILLIMSDINFYNVREYMSSSEILFKYSFQTICPIIFANITCSFLANVGNSLPSIIYRGTLMLMKVVAPIQPNLDWAMYGLFESVLAVLIFIISNYYIIKKTRVEHINSRHKKNPIGTLIILSVLILLVFFVGGFMKYVPTAVMSGSMVPIFERGDAVIIEKLDENDFKNLKLNDIIAYRLDSKIVLHRIIKIDNLDEELVITTKGDNNEYPDNKPVKEDMIIGLVHFRIKYIGYPSVLLSELFSK